MSKKTPLPASLATRRKRTGVHLQAVADRTKIGIRYLEAIEAGDYRALPGGIIALNFLRQYAEAVGVDPAPLLQDYEDRCSPRREPGAEPGFFARLFRIPA